MLERFNWKSSNKIVLFIWVFGGVDYSERDLLQKKFVANIVAESVVSLRGAPGRCPKSNKMIEQVQRNHLWS